MGFLSFLRPRAATQGKDGGRDVTSPDELADVIRQASVGSMAGPAVTPDSAMRAGAVYACVRLISGALANLPLHVKQRVDENTRKDLPDHPVWSIVRRKPNQWQTPSQFKRMLQAHLLLRGNAYALIVRSRENVVSVLPLDPDRMQVKQADDMSLAYTYRRKNGVEVQLKQSEVMHLVGLSLDGVTGVSAITYARETIGLSLAQENHGAKTFKNAARPSIVLRHPGRLGKEGTEFLRSSLDAYRDGGADEGKALIIEEGMEIEKLSMTAQDAQWIESRRFSRTDIAMFFGVPPHMIGDTDKSTSWGTGIEQQSIGFVTYTLEDYLTTWEEAINRDLITAPDTYAKFERRALVRGDLKTRTDHYVKMLQWGVYSPNEVRALEDMNPRADGEVYYEPPNTAGSPSNGGGNDPTQSSGN